MRTSIWLGAMSLAACVVAHSENLTITQPMPYQVIQRGADNLGKIPIKGNWDGRPGRVEARYALMTGSDATPSGWSLVCDIPAAGAFSGSLTAPAGGWHRIDVRALASDQELARQSVEKVGVGEVFLMAGQSNAGNFGWPRLAPLEDRVVTPCQWCQDWRPGYDPQPWAHGGTGGSPWPAMGDALVRALKVPVALIPVAAGGTSVEQWLPASKLCYPALKNALDFVGPHGARAVLWHQGESDVTQGTPAELYAKRLGEIIAQSRRDAGWDIPWGVATVTFLPEGAIPKEKKGLPDIGAAVREGQRKACEGKAVFAGPCTDDMTGPEWRHDTIHFSGKGLREHGRRWAASVLKNLFPDVPAAAATDAAAMAFTSPSPGFVAQRDAQNQGDVPVRGVYDGTLSLVEARWTPMKGGEPSPWTPLATLPKDGIIDGTLRLPAGWHKLDFRGLRDGKPVAERTVERVGVGEVFVVVGGESVANFGQTRQTAKDPRVSGFCGVCFEIPLRDPIRGAIGTQGTSWPALGDTLAAALDLPVEIVVSGYSGTCEQWKPGTPMYNGGLLCSIHYNRRFPKGGFPRPCCGRSASWTPSRGSRRTPTPPRCAASSPRRARMSAGT